MKTLFLTVAATALIFAAPTAFAQDDHHHGHPGGGGHETHAAAPHETHAAAPHETHAAPVSHAVESDHHSRHEMTTTTATPHAPPGWTEKGQGHTERAHENNAMRGSNAMHGNGNTMRGNAMHGGNSHANFHRHNVTASHHYHYRGGSYRWPGGYHYQRWSFGMTLPSVFWAQNYWISDYEDYGLSYPPPGCVWVRYGDDAILIDQYSGEILEVVYDQFD